MRIIFKIYFAILSLLVNSIQAQTTGGLSQSDEAAYLATWSDMIKDSYTEPLPSNFDSKCIATSKSYTTASNLITKTIIGNFNAASFQTECGSSSLCVLSQGSMLTMDGNLNVAALIVKGTVTWTDTTQVLPQQWLCAGYVVVEDKGSFLMSLSSASRKAYIYLKDNGAKHPSALQTRVFGAYSGTVTSSPTIDISGRPLARTWSLLSSPAIMGDSEITLLHDPVAMGWQIGDRIVIAPMDVRSQGTAQPFAITGMSSASNSVSLSVPTNQAFDAQVSSMSRSSVALMSAEVINLSRNIVITGDDFRHMSCDSTLAGPFSDMGCNCNPSISRTQCTLGLHTLLFGHGLMRMQYIRVEKAGQRGIRGKYPLHLHHVSKCPDCLFKGNAIEFTQQRGIIIHETHLASVVDNVLNDVRGTGIFIEDGNEMYNKIMYNVVICPWAKDSTTKHGCTVPGTDNGQADTTLNQAGVWSLTPINYLIGNRFSNSFNGMFYDTGSSRHGQQDAKGLVDTLFTPVLRVEGNTLHGHGRFGSYILSYWGKNCLPNLDLNGQLLSCPGFTSDGLDNGGLNTFSSNVDYSNNFVGGYNVGNLQYQNHISHNNFNNIYWKVSNDFTDGCSAHLANGDYQDGNMALPDMAAFIIENTIFSGSAKIEAAHHCNAGVTGYICMPTYILSNVQWNSGSNTWVSFHMNANEMGGIFVLTPPEALNNAGAGGFFPAGYQSMVFGSRRYLLDFGPSICQHSDQMDNAFPGIPGSVLSSKYSGDSVPSQQGAIFCTKPLRALKIYTTQLDVSMAYTKNSVTYTAAYDLSVSVYENKVGGKLISTFVVPFHQIATRGSDTNPNKQGYAFPVIAGTDYEYRISLLDGKSGNLPLKWIIEFSAPVFGNRWSPDQLVLTVQGRACNKKLITSQHDRRWLWSGTEDMLYNQAFYRGACNSSYPDMPKKSCPVNVPALPVSSVTCDCGKTCNNGYCDCGTKQCMCNSGYFGSDCSMNTCDSVGTYCGSHGRCVSKYLGGMLPVTQSACVCDAGWSGPTCEENPCAGKTCSGHGTCQAYDTDAKCVCDTFYFGANCEFRKDACMNKCPSNYLQNCGLGTGQTKQYNCLVSTGTNAGCRGTTTYVPPSSSKCCWHNCNACSMAFCPHATNDCHLAGQCQEGIPGITDGTCTPQVQRSDGSRCNSVPFGVCKSGICTATSPANRPTLKPVAPVASPPSSKPIALPSAIPITASKAPTIKPSSAKPSMKPVSSSVVSTQMPSIKPVAKPILPSAKPVVNPLASTLKIPSMKPVATYLLSIQPNILATAPTLEPTAISTFAKFPTPTVVDKPFATSKISTNQPIKTPSKILLDITDGSNNSYASKFHNNMVISISSIFGFFCFMGIFLVFYLCQKRSRNNLKRKVSAIDILYTDDGMPIHVISQHVVSPMNSIFSAANSAVDAKSLKVKETSQMNLLLDTKNDNINTVAVATTTTSFVKVSNLMPSESVPLSPKSSNMKSSKSFQPKRLRLQKINNFKYTNNNTDSIIHSKHESNGSIDSSPSSDSSGDNNNSSTSLIKHLTNSPVITCLGTEFLSKTQNRKSDITSTICKTSKLSTHKPCLSDENALSVKNSSSKRVAFMNDTTIYPILNRTDLKPFFNSLWYDKEEIESMSRSDKYCDRIIQSPRISHHELRDVSVPLDQRVKINNNSNNIVLLEHPVPTVPTKSKSAVVNPESNPIATSSYLSQPIRISNSNNKKHVTSRNGPKFAKPLNRDVSSKANHLLIPLPPQPIRYSSPSLRPKGPSLRPRDVAAVINSNKATISSMQNNTINKPLKSSGRLMTTGSMTISPRLLVALETKNQVVKDSELSRIKQFQT